MLAHGGPEARHRSQRCCHLRAGFRRSPSFSPERLSGPHLRGSPSIAPESPALPVNPELTPRTLADQNPAACQLLQSPRFLSTTMDLTYIPPGPAEGYPSALRWCGSVASFEASPAELSQAQGPAVHLPVLPAPPGARSAGACPQSCSTRTPHVTIPCPRRPEKPSAEWMGRCPHELAGGQRKAVRARAASPNFPRRRSGFAHPRCLPSAGSPEGLAHESTGCHQPVEYPLAAPFQSTR